MLKTYLKLKEYEGVNMSLTCYDNWKTRLSMSLYGDFLGRELSLNEVKQLKSACEELIRQQEKFYNDH